MKFDIYITMSMGARIGGVCVVQVYVYVGLTCLCVPMCARESVCVWSKCVWFKCVCDSRIYLCVIQVCVCGSSV